MERESVIDILAYHYFPDLKFISKNRLCVLTDKNRLEVLDKLLTIFKYYGGKFVNKATSYSSTGYIDIDGIWIFVKPKSRQGARSAGIENESFLFDQINLFLSKYGKINVEFSDGVKIRKCKNISQVLMCGKDVAGRKKADIILCGDKEHKLSLKKDNAEIWESADSYYARKADFYLNLATSQAKINLTKIHNYYKIDNGLAIEATKKETKDVVFGSDLQGDNGFVIRRSFSTIDFVFNGKTLRIDVSKIIDSIKDLDEHDKVWFLIRNDKSRRSKDLPYGLRVLAVCQKRIRKNTIAYKEINNAGSTRLP